MRRPSPSFLRRRRVPALAVLSLAALLGLILSAAVTLGTVGDLTRADRIAAEGVLFGAGAFVFAVVATLVATLAWLNSTERPVLRLEAHYSGDSATSAFARWLTPPEQQVPREKLLAIESWGLTATFHNDGNVAARFVALRLTLEGCLFVSPIDDTGVVPLAAGWRMSPENARSAVQLEWTGGADVVVHAGFDFRLPTVLGTLQLRPGIGAKILAEFVANDVASTAIELAIIDPDPSQVSPYEAPSHGPWLSWG